LDPIHKAIPDEVDEVFYKWRFYFTPFDEAKQVASIL
jgi:hypothetical protein